MIQQNLRHLELSRLHCTHIGRLLWDTGAQGNILPLCTFRQIFPGVLDGNGFRRTTKPSNVKLTAYNGTNIRYFSTLTCNAHNNSSPKLATTYATETDGPVIFGLPMCKTIGLITIHCAISKTHSSSVTDNTYSPHSLIDTTQSALPRPIHRHRKNPRDMRTYIEGRGTGSNPPTETCPNPTERQNIMWNRPNGVVGCHKANNGTNQMHFQHHLRPKTRWICPDMPRSKGSKCCTQAQPTPHTHNGGTRAQVQECNSFQQTGPTLRLLEHLSRPWESAYYNV